MISLKSLKPLPDALLPNFTWFEYINDLKRLRVGCFTSYDALRLFRKEVQKFEIPLVYITCFAKHFSTDNMIHTFLDRKAVVQNFVGQTRPRNEFPDNVELWEYHEGMAHYKKLDPFVNEAVYNNFIIIIDEQENLKWKLLNIRKDEKIITCIADAYHKQNKEFLF